jgi:hypothetical protein
MAAALMSSETVRTTIIAVGSSALLLAACASSVPQIEDRSAFMVEAARDFAGETPERVIQAAQAVLKLSDPKDFYFTNNFEWVYRAAPV